MKIYNQNILKIKIYKKDINYRVAGTGTIDGTTFSEKNLPAMILYMTKIMNKIQNPNHMNMKPCPTIFLKSLFLIPIRAGKMKIIGIPKTPPAMSIMKSISVMK